MIDCFYERTKQYANTGPSNLNEISNTSLYKSSAIIAMVILAGISNKKKAKHKHTSIPSNNLELGGYGSGISISDLTNLEVKEC